MDQLLIVAAGLYIAVCGVAGGYVSTQKRREVVEGILFGLFLGPFGVIAAACLPDEPEPADRSDPGSLLTADEQARVRASLAEMSRGRFWK